MNNSKTIQPICTKPAWEFRTLKWIRWSGCLKIILTPSCGDKRKKQPKICSKFQGLTQIFDYNLKTIQWIFTISTLFMFSRSRNPLLTFLLSYVPCLRDLENPSQLPVREVLMILLWIFEISSTIHVFEVRESIADISTKLPCLCYLENPGRLPVQDVLGGTGECVLYIFEISWLHVFGVKESIADISTELLCLGDLENPGRLPVQQVLGGTGDCVL